MERRIIRPHDRPHQRVRVTDEARAREVAALAELMLGAAFADGHKEPVEVVAIAEQLKEFVAVDAMPHLVSKRIERFDPATFDVEAACREIAVQTDEERIAILQLVARVIGAKSGLHPAEEVYLRKVAAGLGIDPDSLQIEVRR
jgi:uncharacterized tellurite resistance protein B-like protein